MITDFTYLSSANDAPVAMVVAVLYSAVTLWYWSGRMPAWMRESRFGAGLCMFGPGGSLVLLGGAVNAVTQDSVTAAVGLAGIAAVPIGMISGIVQLFTVAQWWGPRWLREQQRESNREAKRRKTEEREFRQRKREVHRRWRDERSQGRSEESLAVADPDAYERRVNEALSVAETGDEIAKAIFPGRPVARWRARYVMEYTARDEDGEHRKIGEVPGWLELHRSGVVFYTSRMDDQLAVRSNPVTAWSNEPVLQGVWVVPPGANAEGEVDEDIPHSRHQRLVIEDEDNVLVYALPKAERRAREIAATLNCELRHLAPQQ